MENPQNDNRVRYGVLTYFCDDLYYKVVSLLEREAKLMDDMVKAWEGDGSDIVPILSELDAIWSKLTPRQAALSRLRDMASRESTPVDHIA